MKKVSLLSGMVVLLGIFNSAAQADEISELKQQINEMQTRLEKIESQEEKALPENLQWLEKIKFYGDLRYRYEHIDDEDRSNDRHRNRIRARLGLKTEINDDWSLDFRIATGSNDDPTSRNVDLGGDWGGKDIILDLAYANWHPHSVEGFDMYFGKMVNPFYTAGKNDLIWDGDLTPEGIAATYDMPIGEDTKLHFTGGGFYVDENSSDADTSLWGTQVFLSHSFEDESFVTGGASYYHYANVDGMSAIGPDSDEFFGNSSTAGDTAGSVYTENYRLVELFGEYGFKAGEMPVLLHANWVNNLGADEADTGYLLGAKFNKAKKPGSWEFGYNYRELQADAVLAGFTDSDFIGGGTDGRGHKFYYAYQVAKNVQAGLTYFLAERDASRNDSVSDEDYSRVQADLVFKF